MADIGIILQNAILFTAGNKGLQKFNKAGYNLSALKIVQDDGSLDLHVLMSMLLDVFTEEQASAIMNNVLAKYLETASEEQDRLQEIADEAKMVAPPQAAPVANKEAAAEENLARYLETDSTDVRYLITEARRIRIAMGKSMYPEEQTLILPERERPPAREPLPKKANIVAPAAATELTGDMLEREIEQFARGIKTYSSIDIMDFTRYLKDKGYQFQENIVLENVYTWLEERKNRERDRLTSDILRFLEYRSWPGENEVLAFIGQKKSEGTIFNDAEIKRMVLVEMIHKN